jgi:hypothetical protein
VGEVAAEVQKLVVAQKAPVEQEDPREHLNIIFIGHVGKFTNILCICPKLTYIHPIQMLENRQSVDRSCMYSINKYYL